MRPKQMIFPKRDQVLLIHVSLAANGASSYRDATNMHRKCTALWPACRTLAITEGAVDRTLHLVRADTAGTVTAEISAAVATYSATHDILFAISAHGYSGGGHQFVTCHGTQITDNDLSNALFTHMHPSCTNVCLVDTCHSGTLLGLPRTSLDGTHFQGRRVPIICSAVSVVISACRDTELSAEDVSTYGGWGGGITCQFLDRATPQISVMELYHALREAYAKVNASQHPQLSVSLEYDRIFHCAANPGA